MDIDEVSTNNSYFSKWFNKIISNLGSFDTGLFELFIKADGGNRERLIKAFPEHFLPKRDIKPVIINNLRWYYDVNNSHLFIDQEGTQRMDITLLTKQERAQLFDYLFEHGLLPT